ncbi:hypothetical protein HMPREF1597_05111 [Escherichia coli 907701]|nr:hypothetical protein HMPREF1597_05111 [Escherichia coli 907701]ESE01668.1 hypothetical protein HMPREF1615_03999 [Escherichia coli 908632]ESE13195.1 hypothetical protein HMPREF1618_05423 [Escherichia coli 908691]
MRTRRPDKTRQRRIRRCAPIAGCGVNALSGLQMGTRIKTGADS